MNLLPTGEAQSRVRRMQRELQGSGIDAAFIFQNTDLYYFSGTAQSGLLCIPATGDPIYLVNKSLTRAGHESAWRRIIQFSKLEEAGALLESEGIRHLKKIGLEIDVLPAAYYLKVLKVFPGAEFVDVSRIIRNIRMIKSAHEIEQVRLAVQMLIRAWQHLPDWIRPGATELEVLAEMERYLRLQGHQGIQRTRGFNYEVGYGAFSTGANACFPTSFPGSTGFMGLYPAISNTGSRRRLAPGEPLLVDVSGGYGGYLADAARTYAIGELASDMQEAHKLILDLNGELESLLRPGVECREICEHAFGRVEKTPHGDTFMGAGDNHLRYIGHGVGLELDEWPVLSSGSNVILQPGMTLAIEPKIFFPERGGVGIENMYLITDTGFEKLTNFREDIIYC
jgi:Xaa-Pro dipeptidase